MSIDHAVPRIHPRRRSGLLVATALVLAAAACKSNAVDVEEEETESVEIDASGGTFETPDGSVTLVVPPGAVDAPVEITATQASAPASLGVLPGTVWEFGPAGTRFAEPVELTIRYDPSQVSGNPADLRIVNVLESAGELEIVEHVGHDPAAATVTGLVRHFSRKSVVHCPEGCIPPPALQAEYLGETEGVELSWTTPTWAWVQVYRAVLRQCQPGETSGEYGPYTCVSTPAEALLPPVACLAPNTAPDGTPCLYEKHIRAVGAWGAVRDYSLGSRGAIIWYRARGGLDESPLRRWSRPARQVSYFGASEPPDVPANFQAAALDEKSIRLTWQPTPTASGYELGVLKSGAWHDGLLPYSDFTATYGSLQPSTAYQFRIRSVNEQGSSAYAFANATTGDVVLPGCEDFQLRLDFNPVQVAGGVSDVVTVFVENRVTGFTGAVELVLMTGPGGTTPDDVFSALSFAPNPVPYQLGDLEYSTLSFTPRTGLTVGQEYELELVGGSPSVASAPTLCRIPITFEVVQ